METKNRLIHSRVCRIGHIARRKPRSGFITGLRYASSPFGHKTLTWPNAALLTHWGRVTHICVCKLTIIRSNNGLSPDRHQAIFWTNAGLLSIGSLGTNFSEILIKIQNFSFTKMHMKISSAKLWPFCPRGDELKTSHICIEGYPSEIIGCMIETVFVWSHCGWWCTAAKYWNIYAPKMQFMYSVTNWKHTSLRAVSLYICSLSCTWMPSITMKFLIFIMEIHAFDMTVFVLPKWARILYFYTCNAATQGQVKRNGHYVEQAIIRWNGSITCVTWSCPSHSSETYMHVYAHMLSVCFLHKCSQHHHYYPCPLVS